MDFSDIYITGGQSFVCIQGNEDKFPSLEAANNPEYSIGAQVAPFRPASPRKILPMRISWS